MEIFKLFGSIFVDSAAAQESISKTSEKAETLGGKLGNGIKIAGSWAAGIGAAAVAAGGAIGGLVLKVTDTIGEIDDMSQRTGETAEEFQKYAYAAKLSGIETGTLEKAMIKSQKAFADAKDGSKSMSDAYKRLGIDINSIGSSSEAFDAVIGKLSSMTDETERNTLANDIFGKSYAELTPLFNQGDEGIAKLKQEAVDMGAVISNDSVAAGAELGDSIDRLKTAFGGVANSVGVEFIPIMQSATSWIIDNMPQIKVVVGEVVDFIKAAIHGIADFWKENGDSIKTITSFIWDAIKVVIEDAMKIIQGIIKTIAALINGDWGAFWDGLRDIISGAGKLFYDAGKAVLTALWNGMKSIWESVKNWLDNLMSSATDKLQENKDLLTGVTKTKKKDGSNASGLAYVPYDGYMAELHKGERVLNVNDNRNYGKQNGESGNYSFTFNSPAAMTPAEAARQSKKAMRALQLGF